MPESPPPSVRARGLQKRYGEVAAVDGLDLAVRAGSCLGLLGPNGAGKTTTIEMLEGLTRPDAGEIEILGLTWQRHARALRERIGVQLQETRLPGKLKVREVLRVFASLYRDTRPIGEVLAQVGLEEKAGALVDELSGGQRQRLSLGCALLHRPQVLFLDEPTTGLDPQARRQVWEVVQGFVRGGGAVLLTTHYMEEAERLADELLIVDRGRALVRGTPAEIVAGLEADSILELAARTPAGEAADLGEADLAGLPDVTSARSSDGRVRLAARSFERVLPALMARLQERGFELFDLRVHRPNLDDVFVALAGRRLEDAGEAQPAAASGERAR